MHFTILNVHSFFLCKKKKKIKLKKEKLDPYLLPTHALSSVTQVFNVPVAKVQKYTTIWGSKPTK